jgi:hypothetical protein
MNRVDKRHLLEDLSLRHTNGDLPTTALSLRGLHVEDIGTAVLPALVGVEELAIPGFIFGRISPVWFVGRETVAIS